jgi:hypothetical protein
MKVSDIKVNHMYELNFYRNKWFCKVLKIKDDRIYYNIIKTKMAGGEDYYGFTGKMDSPLKNFLKYAVEDLGEVEQ